MYIVGREQEKYELQRLLKSNQSEFLAVYGRRRVGKTFLIREYFNNKFTFYSTGISRGSRKDQLVHFYESLQEYGLPTKYSTPNNWQEAFRLLQYVLETSKERRKIVFLDEVPWMDTQKSDFLTAIDLFWNTWASARNDIFLIVCGSAASWMVKNLIRNRGGLHNRLTCQLNICPFTLKETKDYLYRNGIKWGIQTIAECYMILGCIPYYLQQLDKSFSLAQNIDRLFFSEAALLKNEYKQLYHSLFKTSDDYLNIIQVLSTKRTGLTRDQIGQKTKISNGGGLTRKLDELEQCGFIRKYTTIGTRGQVYQLIDFFSIFYLTFIKKGKMFDESTWMHIQGSSIHNNWLGYSFERLCFAHLSQIRNALGISGIATRTFSLQADEAQIDMLIERADKTITVCEIKWSNTPYSITKREMDRVLVRLQTAMSHYPNNNIMLCFITSNSLSMNQYAIEHVHNAITLQELFLA